MKAFIIIPSFFPSLSQLYTQQTHKGLSRQGSRKKFSILLASLRNLKFLRYSPFPLPCISKYGAQAGLALDRLNSTEAIHYHTKYSYMNEQTKKLKARNYIQKQQKCRQSVLMEPVTMHHAWREKIPCYPLLSPLATKGILQHNFHTSFVCHFYLYLPRETTATGR